ncbi:MAG: glycosyltransferase family 2 protein [Syntrophobacteraceae bacterium]
MVPRVSVVIPTYNYARYLPEAIESVLSQSYTDFELLIIDDQSTDATVEVVSKYAKGDKRITFRVNPNNIGMVNNWNLCLREARGEYIKYLFADDLLCSRDAILRMVEALDTEPGVSLVASARQIIDSKGRPTRILARFPDSSSIIGKQVINRCLRRQKNLIGEPTAVMFRKHLARRGFNPKYRQIVDLEFWFHLLEKGGFAYIRLPLVAFRVHGNQQTQLNKRNTFAIDDTNLLLSEYVFDEAKPYIELTRLYKTFLRYDYNFQIWKLYRKGVIERRAARDRIASEYGWTRFLLGYSLYTICKPLIKLSGYITYR